MGKAAMEVKSQDKNKKALEQKKKQDAESKTAASKRKAEEQQDEHEKKRLAAFKVTAVFRLNFTELGVKVRFLR